MKSLVGLEERENTVKNWKYFGRRENKMVGEKKKDIKNN